MGKHYVPQKYLRGFEDPTRPGWIWMYDKLRETLNQVPIKDQAQEPDFYPSEVEHDLNELVEKPANTVLDKLRSGTVIDMKDRSTLATYLATMIRRTPHARDAARKIAPKALAEIAAELRNGLRAAAEANGVDPARLQARLAEVDDVEKRFQKQPPQQVVNVIESPWPTPQIVELVHGMVWRLVRCDGPSFFLTSDNPGFFFEGEGLGSLSAELILPIATNRLLHCSWQEDKDEASVHLVPEKVVKVFNQRTAGGADRYVYYHAKKSWVLEVAKNKVEQMSRINWT